MDEYVKETLITNANETSNLDNSFLTNSVLNALKDFNFQKLSPIQHTSLPLGISGLDLIIKEHPGTGRFVLYAILALELIKIELNYTQVLILAPPEEIHMIKDVIIKLGQHLEGLKVSTYDNGTQEDVDVINCHIAISSTNNIRSFITPATLNKNKISLIILDNSDKLIKFDYPMFEELFELFPTKKQIISFASTYSKDLQKFLKKYMNHPLEIGHEIQSSVLLGFSQFVCIINQSLDSTVSITEAKTTQLCSILSKISFKRCIIYTNDESRGIYLSKTVKEKGWNSFYAPFCVNDSEIEKKMKKSKCLISTTSLDMKKFNCDVNLIINYDIPIESTTYIERIGKVRNNTKGIYISLVLPGKELERYENILGEIGGTEMSVPKIDIDDSFFEDVWNVETSSLDHISGITKNWELNSKIKQKLNKTVSDIIKYRVEQCEEDNVASKLKNLSVAHNKNHINPKNDNGRSLELKNFLEELASGRHSTKTGNEGSSTVSTNEKKLPELKTLLEIFTSEINTKENKLNNQEEKIKNTNVNNLLQNLALGNEIQKNDDKGNADDILKRNVALLNVAKLITNCNNLQEVISKDITQPLNGYLSSLKKTEVTSVSTESELEVPVCGNNNNKEDDNFHLKDIFKIGYDFLIKPTSFLKTTDEPRNDLEKQFTEYNEIVSDLMDDKPGPVDQFNELNLQLINENKIPAKADKRKTKSQKNKNKSSKRSKFCEIYNENDDFKQELTTCKEENLTVQESLEVNEGICTLTDAGNSIDQVAESYFDYYSNILWNDGLTFDDVPSLDKWFSQWQAQVQNVRDYIQQKIYLDEMNKFQQN